MHGCRRYMMEDADNIVLENTEIQRKVEVETQSTKKRRRRQVRVERWSPVKRRDSRVAIARKRATREPYQPPTKRRRTWLLRKEIEAICQRLLLLKPDEVLPTVISNVEADTTHFQAFPEREKLWKHITSTSGALCELVRQLILEHISLYRTHHKGKDKYAQFLVAWHELFSLFAVEGNDRGDVTWCTLVSGGDNCSRDAEDRSAIVTAIAKAVYELLTEKASQQVQRQVQSDSMYPQAKKSIPDDDSSVIRVSGFALHSAIEYRRKALLPKSKSKYSNMARQKFKKVELLKRMKATDKLFVPRVVAFQDRGNMTITHPVMLNFGHAVFSTVRSSLNYTMYSASRQESKFFSFT